MDHVNTIEIMSWLDKYEARKECYNLKNVHF